MQETEHLFICFISTFCPKPSPTRLVGNSASAVLHCSPTLCKSPGVTRSSKEVGRAERTWCQGAWAPQAGLDCACSPLRSHRLPLALPGAPSSAGTGAPTPAHRPTALCLFLQSRRTSLGPGRNCPSPPPLIKFPQGLSPSPLPGGTSAAPITAPPPLPRSSMSLGFWKPTVRGGVCFAGNLSPASHSSSNPPPRQGGPEPSSPVGLAEKN